MLTYQLKTQIKVYAQLMTLIYPKGTKYQLLKPSLTELIKSL